jgi:hypothetical protein
MFSLFNRRKNIYQPNITRNRQPYSAPLSSENLNLYYDQFIVDVARLRNNISLIDSKIEEIISLRSDDIDQATPGYYINNEIDFTIYTQKITYSDLSEEYVIESATPYFEDILSFYKPGILSSKISLLEDKLDNLEKTINIE